MIAVSALPLRGGNTARAAVAIAAAILIWELGSRSGEWLGVPVPVLGKVPPPSAVLVSWYGLLGDAGYWQSWYMSFLRVLGGFGAAMIIGIPLGLFMALNRAFHDTFFPAFEVLRPIPPLAWVPAAIVFWPTQELSIAFITFLGAFYTIVINVVDGARAIDSRYFQSAYSMGASRWNVFRRVILPGVIPSIMVGAAVGMGITWEVVVAAEMISGGGSSMSGGGTGGGLGFFIWNSYTGGSYEQIIVGMLSIGIAGYLSSGAIRLLGDLLTPWLRRR
ncbi:MAG: ABC transporter permease [Hyphomicrobiales bacterium]